MVEQRLRLTPSVILDDVPVEEPEYDEFPGTLDLTILQNEKFIICVVPKFLIRF